MHVSVDQASLRVASHRPRIYIGAGLLATLIAFVGFWPTYFGPLLAGTLNKQILIHAHAVVQVTWLALFLVQVTLAGTGRIAQHMTMGRWVAAWGGVVVIVGLVLAFHLFATDIASGEQLRGQRRLFILFRDLTFFATFLGAGWVCRRRRPEIHKRLMLVAATILVLPAVGRMTFLGTPVPLWKFMFVWPLPIYLAMAYDAKRRTIHPVYVVGLLAMLTMHLVPPLQSSATWLAVSGWLAHFF